MTDQLTRRDATISAMAAPVSPSEPAPARWMLRSTQVVIAVALVGGIAMRLHTGSALWLDEALTVNIAELPLHNLVDALRRDGAPPLYYVLLHGWMRLFGSGDVAVRALSSVFAVVTIPLVYVAATRIGGRRAAWFAVALLASSPYAIRYATEARMYSLIVLLTVLGVIAVERAVRAPTAWRLAGVATVAGALALTHYWALFIVASSFAVLLYRRRPRVALALGGGTAVALAPWLSVLLYQLAHTGAPWAPPPGLQVTVDAIVDFAGGYNATGSGVFLGLLLMGLSLIGIWGQGAAPGTVQLRWPGDRTTGTLALVGIGGLVLGVVASVMAGSGFASRYAAITLVLFLVVAAVGIRRLPSLRAQALVLAVCVVLGLVGGFIEVRSPRTQARSVAEVLREHAAPGDLVAYCPDQLGPAVSRLFPPGNGIRHVTYPLETGPEFIDWADYAERNDDGVPERFAHEMSRRAGDGAVWLVYANGYRTYSGDCARIHGTLEAERGGVRYVRRQGRYWERMMLVRFAP